MLSDYRRSLALVYGQIQAIAFKRRQKYGGRMPGNASRHQLAGVKGGGVDVQLRVWDCLNARRGRTKGD
jgi:hypothetical protein